MPKMVPIPYQTLVRVFELEGFTFLRQHGDHLIYVKPGIARPIVIPKYHEIPVFVIKNNLRVAGISRERYFELLQEI